MSTAVVVESLTGVFLRVWEMMGTFIRVCPEHVWNRKFGGWPVWQSVYHSLISVHFFVRQKGDPLPQDPYPVKVSSLEEVYAGPDIPTREDLQALHASLQAVVRAYLDGLTDADLAKINGGLSARRK